MLSYLKINNYALIEESEVDFSGGFTVVAASGNTQMRTVPQTVVPVDDINFRIIRDPALKFAQRVLGKTAVVFREKDICSAVENFFDKTAIPDPYRVTEQKQIFHIISAIPRGCR